MSYTISNGVISNLQMVNDGSFNTIEDLTALGGTIYTTGSVQQSEMSVTAEVNGNNVLGESIIKYQFAFSSSLGTFSPIVTRNSSTLGASLDYIKGEDIAVTITRTSPDNTTAETGSITLSAFDGGENITPPAGKSHPYDFSNGETINGGDSYTWVFSNVQDERIILQVLIDEG